MTAKRRKKLQALAATLPTPKVYGPPEGNVLLVGWGSTRGPLQEAVDRARAAGDSVSSLHLKHLNPLPPGPFSFVSPLRGANSRRLPRPSNSPSSGCI